MPSSPKVNAAIEHFRHAIATGHMPHALIVAGHPRGSGGDFATQLLGLLFRAQTPDALRQHVDIRWIEPESKSRQIRADDGRALIDFIGLTSYEGGWKAGVILFADRMNAATQNILLKTLEEPPPHSCLILVTDSPDALLPTIRSRAQFVDVTETADMQTAAWYPVVMHLLRNPPQRRGCEMFVWADQLTKPLKDLEALARAEMEEAAEAEEADDAPAKSKLSKDIIEGRLSARIKEMREEILRIIQSWQRDVLACACGAESRPLYFPADADYIRAQAEGLSFAEAARRVDAVDEIRRLLEHNIREGAVLPRLARALSSPPK